MHQKNELEETHNASRMKNSKAKKRSCHTTEPDFFIPTPKRTSFRKELDFQRSLHNRVHQGVRTEHV